MSDDPLVKDLRRRMEFGLRCAYAHGVSAIRITRLLIECRSRVDDSTQWRAVGSG